MDELLVRILVSSPIAVAILVVGWLASRAWMPFFLLRWKEFLADRALERNLRALETRDNRRHSERGVRLLDRQARATEALSRSLDRLVSRVDAQGNGRKTDTRKVKRDVDTDEVIPAEFEDTDELPRRAT